MNSIVVDLFSRIVAVSWQSTPVIGLVLVVRHLLGSRIPARWRYGLWILVWVRLLLPLSCLPASSVSLQQIHTLDAPMEQVESVMEKALPPAAAKIPESASVHQDGTPLPVRAPAEQEKEGMPWWSMAAWVWFGVMLLGWVLIMASQFVFSQKVEAARIAVPDWVGRTWGACCHRLKLTRVPRLWISSSVDSPVLMGLIHPRLVLPAALIESHTSKECEHIFAHELAHYRRADHWTNALQLIILSIHWFNPLVWLGFWSARLDREMAADEWALRHLEIEDPQAYGETLLKFISQQSGRGIMQATLGMAESKAQLKGRLRRIVHFGPCTGFGSALGCAVFLALAIPVLSRETNGLFGLAKRGTIYDRHGVALAQNQSSDGKRRYPFQALAAHLIGWLGPQEKPAGDTTTPGPIVGRHGVEAVMEPVLNAGGSVYLTIDARMQSIAETALRHAGVTRGAVVVMDPRNGDVLALASVPDFDPNAFIPQTSGKDWDALNNDPTNPLFNRAIHGYAPASTFKILVALAGLKSGRMSAETTLDCPGSISIGDHIFHNSDHTDAGTMSLVHAISVSNDVFFYQYGIKTGIDAIDKMGNRAGFGQKWGLLGNADEDAGILPGPEWMKQNAAWLKNTHQTDRWSDAQTANTSIGQGFVLVTPLQLTTFFCAVANGGTVYRPRLYDHIAINDDQIETTDWIRKLTTPSQVFKTLDVKPGDLLAVQKGMLEVVQSGTATLAQIPGVQVAGKTGTAQAYLQIDGAIRRDLDTSFCAYAPFQSPRYVVTVMVQGGTWGGTTSAPIAKEILMRLFALEKGQKENVKPLTPVKGAFDHLVDDAPAATPVPQ